MVAFCPGILSFGLPKLAVVALLTRMMNPSRLHAAFMWFLAVFCQLSLMGCVGILFGQCTPTRAMWTIGMERTCIDPWILVKYSIYAGCKLLPLSFILCDGVFQEAGNMPQPWSVVDYLADSDPFISTAFSAFVDLYFAFYPALVLFNLQMNIKKKIALSFALGIGSV